MGTRLDCFFYGCSGAKSCPALCDPMDHSSPAPLSCTISRSFFKLMSIESVMLSNHLSLCCPLLFLPSIFPSIRIFTNESVLRMYSEHFKINTCTYSNVFHAKSSQMCDFQRPWRYMQPRKYRSQLGSINTCHASTQAGISQVSDNEVSVDSQT